MGEMNDDVISRREAINAICEHGTELERRGITVLAVSNHKQVTVDLLESLPSAQPELIRCKDCKWYEIYQLKKDGTDDSRYKPSYCVNLSFHTRPDWFCADGERRKT